MLSLRRSDAILSSGDAILSSGDAIATAGGRYRNGRGGYSCEAFTTIYTTRAMLSSSGSTEVSMLRAGCCGASKGALTPVNSFTSPRRARA